MRYILLLASLVLSACSAVGPKFSGLESIEPGKGAVYFYRPKTMANSATYPTVFLNGAEVADLLDGGFIFVELDPGEYQVEMNNNLLLWPFKRIEFPLKISKGAVRYYRLQSSADMIANRVNFSEVSEQNALRQLPKLNKIN